MKITAILSSTALCLLLAACGGTDKPASTAGGTAEPAKPTSTASETKVAKHPWGSFKVGSYVVTKSTTEVAGRKMSTEMKTTLTALTADKATIEIATTVMGNTSKTTTDMPLTAAAAPAAGGSASTPTAEVKSTEETVTVAGKSLKCKVTTATVGGTESTTWTSEEVPGFMVKSVSKTTGAAASQTTMEVTEYKAN